MSFNWKASGLFAAGVAFGTAGIKILSSKDAKRAYTQCTAAALRAKDCVMKTVNTVQENAEDILAEAKSINEEREAKAEAAKVADAAEDDGDGVGAVDVGHHQYERGQQAQDEVHGEEGQKGSSLLVRYVGVVDLQRKYGVGVQYLFKFIADSFEQHHPSDALKATTRRARTGSDEHAGGQDDPGDVWPLAGVIVEQTSGGDERNNLEDARTECWF